MLDDIRQLAESFYPRMVELRRFFHSHPELAFEEKLTSEKIQATLQDLGIDFEVMAETGVVGNLAGRQQSPLCALRSDIDALPILEKTGLEFKSKSPGRMHACGHDIHMASVLGAAMILVKLRDKLPGSVRFIFQPAEEQPPGGAIKLIDEGVMKKPAVDMIFGLHTDPNIDVGKIGLRDGVLMSEVLDFNLSVKGRGGHGARPHDTVDAVVIASQLVTALQTIVSRNIDPIENAVLTIGRMSGGSARNVIADEVNLEGTIRGTSSETVRLVKTRLEKTCRNISEAFEASFELDYIAGYPVLINNSDANFYITRAAEALFGAECLTYLDNPGLGGEDFSRYLEHAPGAMFRLGIRNAEIGAVHQWHSDRYLCDEKSLLYASSILAGAVYSFLNHQK
jgi:amidohydrolase